MKLSELIRPSTILLECQNKVRRTNGSVNWPEETPARSVNHFIFLINSPSVTSPANTRRWPNVVSRLSQRLRRWPNIKTTLGQRLVLADLLSYSQLSQPKPSYICISANDAQGHYSGLQNQKTITAYLKRCNYCILALYDRSTLGYN